MKIFFSRALALAFVFSFVSSARAGGSHAPIVIGSDADFSACGCVTGGKGTQASPYLIAGWSINGFSGDGVFVDGSTLTKSFNLQNLTVAGTPQSGGAGIHLRNVNPAGTQSIVAEVTGVQTSLQTNEVGILVESSSYVTLDGGGASKNGPGIGETGAGTINKNAGGAIDIEQSSHVTIRGWQLSTNGPSIDPDWVTLDPSTVYWAVGGVRFFGVTSSLIDHNSANNCTDVSYSLFNSSHNTLTSNTADYPFTMNYLLTDGSSYNTLTGNEGSTGDFIGLMIADPLPGTPTLQKYGPSHDNSVVGNTIHTDGPTGNETNPVSVVPAFLGGIVLLNGTYDNVIENNQTWGSFGSDLAWAQAVPSSSTPVGVVTYPPTLHCNVTASEGGGGVGNLNGNVWKGNTFKAIDACLPAQ